MSRSTILNPQHLMRQPKQSYLRVLSGGSGRTLFRRPFLVFFGLVFLLKTTGLFAQNDNIIFERFNTSHGLSNNTVKKIYQDKQRLFMGGNHRWTE